MIHIVLNELFFGVFPSVGLNHASGCDEWCDSGVKACF